MQLHCAQLFEQFFRHSGKSGLLASDCSYPFTDFIRTDTRKLHLSDKQQVTSSWMKPAIFSYIREDELN